MTESGETPERIWIESDGECPYFYHEEELSDVGSPVTEYVRADKLRAAGDGCHCGTCTCNPSMTPAVRFDLSPAQMEGAIRDHLIRLGWTPPDELAQSQQPEARGGGDAAPTSAPVGVEAVRGAWLAAITLANNICVQESDRENDRDGDTGWINGTAECAKRIREYAHPTDAELLEMLDEAGANAAKAALAQQPAAVDGTDAQSAEIEALRAEVERLRADRDSWEQQASDRVADWHAEHLRAERLAEALRELVEVFSESGMYDEEVFDKARAALGQEGK